MKKCVIENIFLYNWEMAVACMAGERTDMSNTSGRKYFEASFAYDHGRFRRDPVDQEGRVLPIIVDHATMRKAYDNLTKKAGSFGSIRMGCDCIARDYLLNGAVVQIRPRPMSVPSYLGVIHETEVGVAFVVNKLELPTKGLLWPDDLSEYFKHKRGD